jgi:hypothetical protein
MTHNEWTYEYTVAPQDVACCLQYLVGKEKACQVLALKIREDKFWAEAYTVCARSQYDTRSQPTQSHFRLAALTSLCKRLLVGGP